MATLLLVIIYLAFISLGLPDSMFGVAWPIIHLEFGLDKSFASYVTIIVALGTIWTSFFTGKIIRKFGTGKVTAFSVGITALALLGISFAPSIWLTIACSIPLGIGAGAVDAGLNDYVARHYKPRHMSWLHCFWGIGVTTSPLIMSKFLENNDWRGGYFTISLMQFCLVIILFAAIPLWKKVADKRTALNLDIAKASADNDIVGQENKDKKINPLKIKGVILAVLSFAFYCGLENTLGTWGASFLIYEKGISAAVAAKWITFYFGGITIGRFITGFLTMKLSDKTLIRGGIVLILIGTILLSLPLTEIAVFIALLFIGTGCAPVFPCSLHATPSRFGANNSPDIIGIQMGFAYIGIVLIQPLFGIIASKTTFAITPYVLMGLALIILLTTELLNFKQKKFNL